MKPLRIQALPAGEVVKLEDVGGPGNWNLEVEVEGHPFNARTVLDAQGAATLAAGALHWLDVHAHEDWVKVLEGPYPTAVRIRGATALTEELNAARDVLTAAGVHGDDLSLPLRIKALVNERGALQAEIAGLRGNLGGAGLAAIQRDAAREELADVRAQFAAANTLIATQREALAELAAIRDAVVTDNSGDDDGWPTSLDAVKAALASWSIALKDSQEESSRLATQRNSARAERDKALVELDRRDTESGRLLRDVEDLGGRLQAAQAEADTARRLLGEVLVQAMLRGAVLTLPVLGEVLVQAMLRGAVLTLPDKTEEVDRASEVPRG